MIRPLMVLLVIGSVTAARAQPPRTYDRVVLGGRVMDPVSPLDAVRNLGLRDGRIATITASPIRGRDTVDARGLVVAPGFVDLHAHGQNAESDGYYAMNGVTTALELEIGIGSVDRLYVERAGKTRVNYGGGGAHFQARRVAFGDTLVPYERRDADTSTRWSHAPSTPAAIATCRAELEKDFDLGALGVGMGIG